MINIGETSKIRITKQQKLKIMEDQIEEHNMLQQYMEDVL